MMKVFHSGPSPKTVFVWLSIFSCGLLTACGKETPNESLSVQKSHFLSDQISPVKKVDKIKREDHRDVNLCSFNIQFLGMSKVRKDKFLTDLIKDCDIVAIQELVAPPCSKVKETDGSFSNLHFPSSGNLYKKDDESHRFFREMLDGEDPCQTFDSLVASNDVPEFWYVLSEEDTGRTKNQVNSSASEWFVVFYQTSKVSKVDNKELTGFISQPLVHNPNFQRVPHAFTFTNNKTRKQYTILSNHLPFEIDDEHGKDIGGERRIAELKSMGSWTRKMAAKYTDNDFFIIGDMNLSSVSEINGATPEGFVSLNMECVKTNTSTGSSKCYDHIMIPEGQVREQMSPMMVVDLNVAAKVPDSAYDHDDFRARYSDHKPIYISLSE